MTDEGQIGEPMDEVEMVRAVENLALLSRTFYENLIEQGFNATESLRLCAAQIHGTAGGKFE